MFHSRRVVMIRRIPVWFVVLTFTLSGAVPVFAAGRGNGNPPAWSKGESELLVSKSATKNKKKKKKDEKSKRGKKEKDDDDEKGKKKRAEIDSRFICTPIQQAAV
jgi:hypothetical protein